jgi:membrane protease YdiL (CAAX protease family)
MANKSGWRISLFLLILLAISFPFHFFAVKAGLTSGGSLNLYVLGLMWSPALAAMAAVKLTGGPFSEFGWKWPTARWAWMGWIIPLAYTAIAYAIVWICGLGGFPNRDLMQQMVATMGLHASPLVSTMLYVLLTGTFGMARGVSTALGEEIGWRGFLVPELFKNRSFGWTCCISAVIWTLYHVPVLVWGDYNEGTPSWYGLSCFTILIIATTVIVNWLRLRSRSVWTSTLLHASHNIFVQRIFTPLTSDKGKTAWFVDEFGIVLPLVMLGFAIYFWRRRHELESPVSDRSTAQAAVQVAV